MSRDQAFHGGAFFEAVGADLRNLDRSGRIVSADVLDAWFDPSPRVTAFLREHLEFLLKTSPPNHAEGLIAEVANSREVPPESVLAGSGSSSILFHCLPRLLPARPKAVVMDPMYSEYEHIVETLLDGELIRMTLAEAAGFVPSATALAALVARERPDAVLLVNPCNPTGRLWPRHDLLAALDSVPDETLAVVDETYIEYAGASASLEREAASRRNLVVVKSMSKAYALSGARVAYMVSHPDRIRKLARWIPPWPVGLPSQAAAMEALRDPAYYSAKYAETAVLRAHCLEALRGRAVPSESNFYLVRTDEPARVARLLRGRSIFVREFPDGPLAGAWLRVAVKSAEQNARILDALQEALSAGEPEG
jgi:histidinol-phosphate/aromatic aminotransferase/cobyric acid decarboxylase-like protein